MSTQLLAPSSAVVPVDTEPRPTRPGEAPCCAATVAAMRQAMAADQRLTASLVRTRAVIGEQRNALRRGLGAILEALDAGETGRVRDIVGHLRWEQHELERSLDRPAPDRH